MGLTCRKVYGLYLQNYVVHIPRKVYDPRVQKGIKSKSQKSSHVHKGSEG